MHVTFSRIPAFFRLAHLCLVLIDPKWVFWRETVVPVSHSWFSREPQLVQTSRARVKEKNERKNDEPYASMYIYLNAHWKNFTSSKMEHITDKFKESACDNKFSACENFTQFPVTDALVAMSFVRS